MEDNYACANSCEEIKYLKDEYIKRCVALEEEMDYWRSVCFRLQHIGVEKLMMESSRPIVLQLPKDSDVLSLINANHEQETEIVPSHPVFWAKQWKCLSCGELIDLPKMTDVCDYKYCPYCSAKNTICGKTMEDLHIREDDESGSKTD